jgi:hypothetical protein
MMDVRTWLTAGLAGLLAATLSCAPAATGHLPAAAELDSPLGVPRSLRGADGGAVLVLDRGDPRLGTTVQFRRVPTLAELDELRFVRGLTHVVLSLDRWPEEYAPLSTLDRLPTEVDLLVVLQGYPPSRAAGQAWNLLSTTTRIVIVAGGPPPAGVAYDLNAMRALEAVVVDTDDPSMSGFEHLQRPVAFRVVRE